MTEWSLQLPLDVTRLEEQRAPRVEALANTVAPSAFVEIGNHPAIVARIELTPGTDPNRAIARFGGTHGESRRRGRTPLAHHCEMYTPSAGRAGGSLQPSVQSGGSSVRSTLQAGSPST